MFQTIADVREANKAAGGHFFDAKTMRFFASRVESTLYAGRYFITSEKAGFESRQRKYTIREVTPDADVRTVADFQKFDDKREARAAVRELVSALTHFVLILTREGFTASAGSWVDADCGRRVKAERVDNDAPTCPACHEAHERHVELYRAHAAGELHVTVTRL